MIRRFGARREGAHAWIAMHHAGLVPAVADRRPRRIDLGGA
jgi:hypothetical protein